MEKLVYFEKAVKLLRELADLQNGAPLLRYEKNWQKVMDEIYHFLSEHESKGEVKIMNDVLTRFLKKAENHYWDSFEEDRNIILSHINSIAIILRKEIHDENEHDGRTP